MKQTLISTRIEDGMAVDGLRLITLKTSIEEMVTIQGSFLGGEVYCSSDNKAVAELTADMLEEGTLYQDKFAISEKLEEVGASISFWVGKYRVRFKALCLKKDVPLVIELLAEQLRSPAFHEEDFISSKKRRVGELKRSMEETRVRAMETFLQELYPEGHPNFQYPIPQQIRDTERVTVDDLNQFHQAHYGLGNMIMVAVGDVNRTLFEKKVQETFSRWKETDLSIDIIRGLKAKERLESYSTHVDMKDKTSVDLIMGQPVGIDREHEDFLPLMVGHYILGGNFSARLMATVRDQEGLTYGIRSSLAGVENRNDGFWYIWGTFAPQLLKMGQESAYRQLKKWTEEGVTKEELEAKKTTLTGTYQVALATTGGLASQILSIVERGKEIPYIDEYPQEINAIELKKVNRVIKQYTHIHSLILVSAGSVIESRNP